MKSKYTADTHSLVWNFKDPLRLTSKVKKIFNAADAGRTKIFISTITLVEIIRIAEKKRLGKYSLPELIQILDKHPSYKIVNLDSKTVLQASKFNFSTDLHDRLITATAFLQKTPLITKDEKIINANIVETVWG